MAFVQDSAWLVAFRTSVFLRMGGTNPLLGFDDAGPVVAGFNPHPLRVFPCIRVDTPLGSGHWTLETSFLNFGVNWNSLHYIPGDFALPPIIQPRGPRVRMIGQVLHIFQSHPLLQECRDGGHAEGMCRDQHRLICFQIRTLPYFLISGSKRSQRSRCYRQSPKY